MASQQSDIERYQAHIKEIHTVFPYPFFVSTAMLEDSKRLALLLKITFTNTILREIRACSTGAVGNLNYELGYDYFNGTDCSRGVFYVSRQYAEYAKTRLKELGCGVEEIKDPFSSLKMEDDEALTRTDDLVYFWVDYSFQPFEEDENEPGLGTTR